MSCTIYIIFRLERYDDSKNIRFIILRLPNDEMALNLDCFMH
jgi:hypothetical protein